MRERVLIVDDDPVQRRLLDDVMRKFGYEPIMAASGNAAMAALAGAESARTDAVVLDLVMPDPDGLGTLAKMRAAGLATPVIVQSSRGGGDDLVTAMRAEATDFVIKPVDAERLRVLLRNALSARAPAAELARSTRPRSDTPSCHDIIGESPRVAAAVRPAAMPAAGLLALVDGNGELRPLDDIEADAIRFAITHYRGQMSEVARRLRIGRSTLYRKLDSLQLDTGISEKEPGVAIR
jgi:DNA-binding NtrC family response regulator